MSGGHYPPSYHNMQSSQEYVAPRHRLPVIPPPRPTSSYSSSSSISHAHASSWMNKHSYSSNYRENVYSSTPLRNYSPVARAHYNEDLSRWSDSNISNSSNTPCRSVTQSNKIDTTMRAGFVKEDIQQESMDLSSAAQVSTITQPIKSSVLEIKSTSVNGGTNNEQVAKKNYILSANINGAEGKQDLKTTQPKTEVVSVIAQNPMREKTVSHIVSPGSVVKITPRAKNLSEESDNLKIDKHDLRVVSLDHVESALETIFSTDNRSSIPSASSSVIVTAQSCKTPPKNLTAESIKNILKSPDKSNKELTSQSIHQSMKKAVIPEINIAEDEKISGISLEDGSSVDERSHITNLVIDKKHVNISSSIKKSNINSVDLISNIDSRLKQSSTSNITFPEIVSNIVDSIFEKSITKQEPKNLKESCHSEINTNEKIETEIIKVENNQTRFEERMPIDSFVCTNKELEFDRTAKSKIEEPKKNLIQLKNKHDANVINTVNSDTNENETENPEKNKSRNEEITYVEVESELEKMFAGIEDTGSKINKTNTDQANAVSIDSIKTTVPVTSSQPVLGIQNSEQPKISLEGPAIASKASKKKKSLKKSKSAKNLKDRKQQGTVRDNLSAETIAMKRIPVIHIEGSKENPISVQIINSIKLEEDDMSDGKVAGKRKLPKSDRTVKKLATHYSIKKYDPESSDESWICVLCKLPAYGPGVAGEPSGDLFGPYFIKNPNQSEGESKEKGNSRKSSDHSAEPAKNKQKTSSSADSSLFNASETKEQKAMEIWAHENCFVWASGIHLIGSELIGLEDAVLDSLKTICSHCGENGASIGCRSRHCKSYVHYSCALHTGWKLDSETFITVCNTHKIPD